MYKLCIVEYSNQNRKNVVWDKEKRKCMTEGRKQVVVSKRVLRVGFIVKGIWKRWELSMEIPVRSSQREVIVSSKALRLRCAFWIELNVRCKKESPRWLQDFWQELLREAVINWDEEDCEYDKLGDEEDKFNFEHVEFGMSSRNPHGDMEKVIKHTSLQSKREIWPGGINLAVLNV